jgi:hypothetical protein
MTPAGSGQCARSVSREGSDIEASYVEEMIPPYPDLSLAFENKIKTQPELSSLREY